MGQQSYRRRPAPGITLRPCRWSVRGVDPLQKKPVAADPECGPLLQSEVSAVPTSTERERELQLSRDLTRQVQAALKQATYRAECAEAALAEAAAQSLLLRAQIGVERDRVADAENTIRGLELASARQREDLEKLKAHADQLENSASSYILLRSRRLAARSRPLHLSVRLVRRLASLFTRVRG